MVRAGNKGARSAGLVIGELASGMCQLAGTLQFLHDALLRKALSGIAAYRWAAATLLGGIS